MVPSTRLQGFDYSSPGYYFVTICTKDKIQSLGKIESEMFKPTDIGTICQKYWHDIPNHYPNTKLYEFCVMPNHIHSIIEIRRDVARNVLEPEHRKFNNTSQINTASLSILQNNKIHPNPRDVACNVSTKDTNDHFSIMSPQKNSIPSIIRSYKYATGQFAKKNNIPFSWQPRYHDHIIRSEKEFYAIAKYIEDNLKNWHQDTENIN